MLQYIGVFFIITGCCVFFYYLNKKVAEKEEYELIHAIESSNENDPLFIQKKENYLENQFNEYLVKLDKLTDKNKAKQIYLGKKVIELMSLYLDDYNTLIHDKTKIKKVMSPFQYMVLVYGCRSIIKYSDRKALLLILSDLLHFITKYYHIHGLYSLIYNENISRNENIKKQALCYCILKFFSGHVSYDIVRNISKNYEDLDDNVFIKYKKLRSNLINQSIKYRYPRAIRYYEKKIKNKK